MNDPDWLGFNRWHPLRARFRCNQPLESRLQELTQLLRTEQDSSGQSLLKNTVIAVISEMGRTPKYNAASGKDHWPYTSAMFISDAFEGGRVLGASTEQLVGMPIDMRTGLPSDTGRVLSAASLLAGILDGFGVTTENFFPDEPVFSALFS